MCGIVGIVSQNCVLGYREKFLKALDVLKHRGPNHRHYIIDKHYALGYVRLRIRGNESCNQAIRLKDGFAYGNGENYSSPADDKCDLYDLAESIIKRDGKLFDYDADFALTVLDCKTNTFFLARDRFGVKPLFYSWIDSRTICFASEIKAIKQIIGVICPSLQGISDYLIFGYPLKERTAYERVYAFPPKGVFEWDLNSDKKKFICGRKTVGCEGSIKCNFSELLKRSINVRLISDYKITTHLSGGLDSSIINFFAKELSQDIVAFTGFYDKWDRDYTVATVFAQRFDIRQKAVRMKARKNYKRLIKTLDSPIMSTGAFVPYELARKIGKMRYRVLLEGQGADEILLGYSRFLNITEPLSPQNALLLLANADLDMLQKILKIDYNRLYEQDLQMCTDIIAVQQFYIDNFLQELLKIEDHANMSYSIENRTPFLSKFFEDYLLSVGKVEIGKSRLKELHAHLKTGINVNQQKINANCPLQNELVAQRKLFERLLKEGILSDVDCGMICGMLNRIDGMSKKQQFTLWMIFNILLWAKINKYYNISLGKTSHNDENSIIKF